MSFSGVTLRTPARMTNIIMTMAPAIKTSDTGARIAFRTIVVGCNGGSGDGQLKGGFFSPFFFLSLSLFRFGSDILIGVGGYDVTPQHQRKWSALIGVLAGCLVLTRCCREEKEGSRSKKEKERCAAAFCLRWRKGKANMKSKYEKQI